MKPGETCHIVTLPLRVNSREAQILEQRLRVRGQLRNAALQTLLERVEVMRADPRWLAARLLNGKEQVRAYQDLRDEFLVSKREACNAAFRHWQASRWMPSVIDSRIALELGTEVWGQVSAWMYGRQSRPRFKPVRETDTVWGADNHAGLRLKGDRVVWNNKLTKRKNLSLALECDPGQWARRVEGREVIRVGVRREKVRGRTRWFALLCLAGEPHRDPAYLKAAKKKAVVGIDAGPSKLAVVSRNGSDTYDLAPVELLAGRRAEAARIRRRQRALDRSRRATNPDCFDEQGRWQKGKRATVKSKRFEQLEQAQRSEQRRAAVHRRADETQLARWVMVEHGAVVAQEDLDFRAWPRSFYGKRTGFTAPGSMLNRIAREAERAGGADVPLDTKALALSQHCLCGARVKKELSNRIHECGSCGLGPLDRDLFSAFLAYLVASEGVTDLSTGTLNRAGTRRKAQALCAPERTTVPARRSGGRKAGDGRLVRERVGQTPRTRPARASVLGASRQATPLRTDMSDDSAAYFAGAS